MSRDGRNRGFTLVELMVAVVISFIVVGWIYSTYIVHQRVFSTETQITDLQYEGSTAISVLAKDLRESGFGVPENPNINGVTSSLIISDSGTDGGPDTLTLLGGYRVIATLAQDINPGMTSFKVTWQGGISANTSDRSHISVDGISYFQISNINNDTITVSQPVPRFIPSGRPIYLIEDVTYSVSNGTLFRASPTSTPGGDPIVDNVDDFQVASLDLDGDSNVDAVRISLLVRTERETAVALTPQNQTITLENNSTSTNDFYRRRIYRKTIYLRNGVK